MVNCSPPERDFWVRILVPPHEFAPLFVGQGFDMKNYKLYALGIQ